MNIILVIGHGGIKHDPGAININLGITEFDWNNNFVQNILKPLLKKEKIPFKIVYRREYKSLPMDINQISNKEDIILSFHCNAVDNFRVSGTETLYYKGSKKGKRLAEVINSAIVNALNLRDRGIKPKSKGDRGAYLLQKTIAPCVILESFFISNDNDLKIATMSMDRLANELIKGIKKYAS